MREAIQTILNRALVYDHCRTFAGFHQFPTPCEEATSPAGWRMPEPQGSFEVFYADENESWVQNEKGWYWWSCFLGCLPDGEPNGPFLTAEGAYLDAIGD